MLSGAVARVETSHRDFSRRFTHCREKASLVSVNVSQSHYIVLLGRFAMGTVRQIENLDSDPKGKGTALAVEEFNDSCRFYNSGTDPVLLKNISVCPFEKYTKKEIPHQNVIFP